jgi:hypothetical protein
LPPGRPRGLVYGAHESSETSQAAAMSHAALVDDGLLFIVGFLTLLLVMFLFAVIATPPEPAGSSEAHAPCAARK